MDAETKGLIERLSQRIAELEAENRSLREQLEAAQRTAARQAAPFRRPEQRRVAESEKKRPGRPKGHPGSQRAIPQHIDNHVDVPLERCPECHGPVTNVAPSEHYIEELAPPRPEVTKLVTYSGKCPRCGVVRSAHPLQTAPGPGGSLVQIGPRALAAAAQLNKQFGLTMRKTCRVLHSLTGLRLTAGGLAQALQRAAVRVEPEYDKLVAAVRESAAVFVDETSWWVNGPGWWLWVFTNDTTTAYVVDKGRGSNVVQQILGTDFKGMLVSDCLPSYDPPECRKHKCIAHHLRAIKEAQERSDTRDQAYLKEWNHLFWMVSAIWKHRARLPANEFVRSKLKLREWADRLLAIAVVQPGDVAIRNRLQRQREHLFGCLDEPAAEPTNNRAERALRPAVIARKLSCGNRTEAGKRCWETLASLAETCHQRGTDFVDWLAKRLEPPLAG